MVDRPNLKELIEAVQQHLEASIIPAVRGDGKLYFQTLVAINVLRIAGREIELGRDHAEGEWQRLNTLTSDSQVLPERLDVIHSGLAERNQVLSQAIRAGAYDDNAAQLLEHLKATTIDALMLANPRFLQTLAAEEADPALDAWEGRSS